ncbi:hypothetical protein [Aureibacter tunicatorum]|nr:hypothetical protein [Aureibacter tunicatorum]
MKAFLLLFSAIGILSLSAKGIDLKETKDKLMVSIGSIGKPSFDAGHMHLPVDIRFNNNGAGQLRIDSIFATVHAIDSTGASVQIASTMPQPEHQILAPNQKSVKQLTFSIPLLSGASNISHLLKTKQLKITAVPKINGFDTPPIVEILPINLGNIFNFAGLLNAGQG